MRSSDEWYSIIAADAHLPPDAAQQLREKGFIVMPGPAIPGGCEQLSNAYDREVAIADPAERHVSRNKSTTRTNDFVNRGSEFDGIYVYPPLLAACCQIIGGPFKLSGMRQGRSILAHRPNGFTSMSNIRPTDGRWWAVC